MQQCTMCSLPIGTKGQLSYYFKYDRVEITVMLAFFFFFFFWFVFVWLKPLTDEGGKETGVPRGNCHCQTSEATTAYQKDQRLEPVDNTLVPTPYQRLFFYF